jgi:hypothetical protein
VHDLDVAGIVLVHREGIDDPNRVTFAETFQFGDDLAVEVGIREAKSDQLHWSNSHTGFLSGWFGPALASRGETRRCHPLGITIPNGLLGARHANEVKRLA